MFLLQYHRNRKMDIGLDITLRFTIQATRLKVNFNLQHQAMRGQTPFPLKIAPVRLVSED